MSARIKIVLLTIANWNFFSSIPSKINLMFEYISYPTCEKQNSLQQCKLSRHQQSDATVYTYKNSQLNGLFWHRIVQINKSSQLLVRLKFERKNDIKL